MSSQRIESLLSQMTLEEKVSLLAGLNFWSTVPIERLGIPAVHVTDGPNGARGTGGFAGGPTSACFPCGIALAATWNTELIEQVGVALGQETLSKGARCLLAPTVNIHRSPLNGRNFECYSEDPYLSGRMAAAYVRGLQSQGVSATVKHFVCNDSEFERLTISSEVRDRALYEIYLPPFKAAVQEGGAWAVMSSYNKINGVYASENARTITEILRGEWGFTGIVMSDWTGTKSTVESVNAGQDLEMPGPPTFRGPKLLQAVKEGKVSEETIDACVRRLLLWIERVGAFGDPAPRQPQAIDLPEHRALIRRAAGEAAVLLKNSPAVLPIDPQKVRRIVVIGPNAKTARVMGGGSAHVTPHYVVSPYDGILARAQGRFEVGYELGCTNHRALPLLETAWLADGCWQVEYFNNLELEGQPAHVETSRYSELNWLANALPAGVDPKGFSARFSARLIAPESGLFTFSLASVGQSRLFLDGVQLVDNWTNPQRGNYFMGFGSREESGQASLEAGRSYDLRVEFKPTSGAFLSAVRIGLLPPLPADAIQRAADLAAASDLALVFVGLSDEWESEGFDRPDLELVGEQNALVARVAAANPNTVVVLNTGSPVTMPWLDQVAAVLQAWFPGQECGNAIADVLFGDLTPSGKLPQTFPRRLEDNPAYINYPGENGKVYYGEGIFVGYRYYEKKKIQPLFPFGFGLSYTTFEYSNLRLSAECIAPGEELTVQVDVTNTGARPGQEVVQLYLRDPLSRLMRPEKELKGFVKLALQPGERRTATFRLDAQSLAYFDDLAHCWVAEAGEFQVLVGSSSADIRLQAAFTLTETAELKGMPKKAAKLSLKSSLAELLADERARAALNQLFPGFLDAPQLSMAMGMSIEQIAAFAPQYLTPELLAKLAAELEKID